jgi:predicted metal-dependent enzyme (double-stranded beta helix superfamily)
MFDKEQFIADCRRAVTEGQQAVREVVREAVADPAAVFAALGEPERAGITPLHRAPDLTIMNFVWAPCMSLVPHNHKMFSVVGLYAGREDNLFWRRTEATIEAAGAKSLGAGEVTTLGRDIIHSVLNPIGKMTCAFHVYGGDFFGTEERRSEWDHETLEERPWDIEKVKGRFREAEARYDAYEHAQMATR